jgi:tyrosyl-tRNA synthetase
LQLGGSDQWGNITVGTELVRKATGHSADGVTTPLLLRADGQKFGKSEGGNESVWLDASMTSPFALHQFLLNADDVAAPAILRYFTFLDHETILDLDEATRTVPQERRAQRASANAIVTMVHGEDAAARAERAGEALFAESIADLDEATLLQVVADAPSSKVARSELESGIDAADLVARCELATSLGEARRFIEQGGVYVNNVRVEVGANVNASQLLHGRYVILRRGRRQMHLVVVA